MSPLFEGIMVVGGLFGCVWLFTTLPIAATLLGIWIVSGAMG
jgi:hypothetical protein